MFLSLQQIPTSNTGFSFLSKFPIKIVCWSLWDLPVLSWRKKSINFFSSFLSKMSLILGEFYFYLPHFTVTVLLNTYIEYIATYLLPMRKVHKIAASIFESQTFFKCLCRKKVACFNFRLTSILKLWKWTSWASKNYVP